MLGKMHSNIQFVVSPKNTRITRFLVRLWGSCGEFFVFHYLFLFWSFPGLFAVHLIKIITSNIVTGMLLREIRHCRHSIVRARRIDTKLRAHCWIPTILSFAISIFSEAFLFISTTAKNNYEITDRHVSLGMVIDVFRWIDGELFSRTLNRKPNWEEFTVSSVSCVRFSNTNFCLMIVLQHQFQKPN